MSFHHAFGLFICSAILLLVGPAALAQETAKPVPVAVMPETEAIQVTKLRQKRKEWLEERAAEGADAKVEAGKDEVTDKLRQQLLGAWLMAPKPGQEKADDSRIGVQQKFFGLGHWIYTLADPETGELVGSHGGTYSLKGDVYEETIKFAAFSTEEMIGQSFKFKLTVDGNRLVQRGIGNSFNEDYTRLKAGDAEPKE